MHATQNISVLWSRLHWTMLIIALGAGLNAHAQTTAAPALTFATVEGQKIRLSDLRGKIVLINFWATSCAICLAELPDLIQTYQQYRNRGLEVIAIAMPYDQSDLIKQYVAKHGLPFPVVWDAKGDIGHRFGKIRGTPTTFIVDKNGQVISQTIGIIDFGKLRKFLDDALG